MKLQILSDLHREFYRKRSEPMPLPWRPAPETDVFVLAGDIDTCGEAAEWLADEAERLAKPFIYVPGNHEYYGGILEDRLAAMRERLYGTRVHLLDCDEAVIEGVRFLGATLWTDYKASLGSACQDIIAAIIESTGMRLVSNQAGYPHETGVGFELVKLVEVESA